MYDPKQEKRELEYSVVHLREEVQSLLNHKKTLETQITDIRGGNVKVQLRDLERKKQELEKSIKLLNENSKSLFDQKQRLIYAVQVVNYYSNKKTKNLQKLDLIINSLNTGIERTKKEIDEWKSKQYIDTDKELLNKKNIIKQRQSNLDIRDKQLTEKSLYLEQLEEEAKKRIHVAIESEKTARIGVQSNISRHELLVKREKELNNKENSIEVKRKEITSFHKEIEQLKITQNDLTLKTKKEHNKVNKLRKRLEGDVRSRLNELNLKLKALDEKEDVLKLKEKRLEDREQTLARAFDEARRKNIL